MKKLILKMSISVDGFVAGANGEGDMLSAKADPVGAAWVVERLSDASAHLLGRKSFQQTASFWPTSNLPFAPPMNEIPKIVFSRTGFDPAACGSTGKVWNEARVLTGNLAQELTELKKAPGKNLVAMGGADFARNLVITGLVDEFHLVVFPVAIGRGTPLFSGLKKPLPLQLESAQSFPSGVVAKIYRSVKAD